MRLGLIPLLSVCTAFIALAQNAKVATLEPKLLACSEQTPECTHRLLNGFTYKTLVGPRATVTMSLADNGKYTRVNVMIVNSGQLPFDVLPSAFDLSTTTPKQRALRFISPEKMEASARRSVAWADALNSMGAGMATKQVTTETTGSGAVQATGSNGGSANGTYNGTSTSITNVPDYAAQARVRENIERRRADLAAHEAQLEQTALRANTVDAGRSVGGFVYFESEKHGELYVLNIPIDGTIYQFPFERTRK